MKDPVIDINNPNPTIDRAASTRRHSQKNQEEGRAPPGSKSTSSSTKPSRPAVPATSAAKWSSSKAPGALVINEAKSLASTQSPASSQVNSPTTASAARSVLAPQPRPPAFGSSEPRLPSHMRNAGQRGPAPVNLNVDSSPTSFEHISAPADDMASIPSPAGKIAPSSRPSHIHLLSAVVRTANSDGSGKRSGQSNSSSRNSIDRSNRSSTSAAASYTPQRPPSAKDAGPNESITVALARKSPTTQKSEQEYPRLLQGPGVSIDVYEEPICASGQRYHGAWDPNDGTEDPLAVFGAEGGELPVLTPPVP
ncbi:hypothetical protein R3P38DRAFT_3193174 [Favolaschia claudopus]|uniref:Uncharacterized protein n=1 Tax=Favolaschia claudopus TaxID=2862362 RepID=A0AAW0BH23_9AGAR